uniref:ABC-type glutathione-S-conjugate transporter n=1 Tax=Hucho hucho TaxID=62062 RepID=A0A4W5R8N7_9TELE
MRWVANETLHTDSPDLPECFQLSVLSWLPCVYLWLACPPYLFYLQRNNMGYIMMSVLNRVKTVFALVLWIVCWTDLFGTFNELHQGDTKPPIYFVTPLVVGITMLLATFLIQFERLRGVQSSGILFIFWFLSVLCAIVPFRSKILQAKSEIPDKLRFITFYLYFSLVLSQLILSCFKEKPSLFSNVDTDPNPCPQSTAGFLSTMTFWWFTSMAIKGYKNPLEAKDLWSLNKKDSSEEVVPKLLREWDLEQIKEVEVLLSKKKTPKKPSFLRSLIKAFGPYFLIGSAYKLLQDLITFVNPQLLSLLISFTKQKDAPTWWGYALAFLMFFTALLQTLILHQHFQYCFVTGMRLRTSIIGAIYRKSLIITNAAKRTSTVGEIVNLMSVDAQRFMDLTTFLNMLWSAPLQIILALYFLWQNLGPSVLAGVAVMILLIPLNAAIAVRTRAYQVYTAPSATLRAYRWGQGVEVVMMMMMMIVIIKSHLFIKPFLHQLMSQSASVSLKRIQDFLSHEELDLESVDRNNTATGKHGRVTVVNGKFTWAKQDPPALHNINLMVPQGSLLAVVGHVGCGKSSLVSALLGEMEKLEGHISIRGSVAYVPQQAWIQNATLRDNILFGKAYNEQKYRSCLEACALTPDLEVLPGGDLTEIGEKGINLSGGQRQRVSLARAVYNEADVYLLDDPLSAVDSHVAKHIFDHVIGPEGALQGKTRILVTHGISFLPQVNNIVVLVEGRVSEMGSYQELLQQNGAFAEFLRNYSLEDIVEDEATGDLENPRSKSVRRRLCSERKHAEPDPEKKLPKVEKLIQAETTETGRVKSKVFWEYVKAVGPLLTLFICFLYGCQNAAAIGANVWLSQWTNDAAQNMTQENISMRVGVYAALGIAQGILVMVSSFTLAMGNIGAARKLHYALLDNKFHTPQSFFDTTPIGRVINRFSKDIYVIDEALPSTVLMFLGTFFSSLSTMIVIVASTPIFAVVIAPLAFIYIFVQVLVLPSIRVRIEFIGNCIVLFAALFAVIGKNELNPGLVGLSVSYALMVTMSLNWMVRMTSDLESNIVAVERVKEYSESKTEAPWEVEDKKPSPDWPSQGKVEFLDYSVRYREGLDLVLKNLTLSVRGGEKIGIVGRTGAGKSSMTLCLFRLLEAAGGEITIDGVKISEIGLHDLRSKLTIIPQEPVLFSGSLRMNLDPFDKYNDVEVWKALELSHLNKFVSNQPAKLELECSEGGENLSVGQRQLVCLARALLRKTRILILDEATAAIDLETDDLIQSTIRTEFEDCTVFTIAHRLNTIMDYTRVLVLDKGQVAEFDTPTKLLSKRGIFYGMAKDAGLAQ